MSPREIDSMRSVEDDLWWYRALHRLVLDAIDPPRPDFKLLDAGCGSGGMLARVRERFPDAALTGLDFSPRAVELTRERKTGATVVEGSTEALPFHSDEFDVVLSLDVIVLREIDDARAAGELHRVLRPGGRLIINLPAFDFLAGSHDAAIEMGRRYTRKRVRALLTGAGFTIQKLSYWNMTMFPAVAAVRWASRRKASDPDIRSDVKPIWPPLNRALSRLIQLEVAAARQFSLPIGTSVFAVASK